MNEYLQTKISKRNKHMYINMIIFFMLNLMLVVLLGYVGIDDFFESNAFIYGMIFLLFIVIFIIFIIIRFIKLQKSLYNDYYSLSSEEKKILDRELKNPIEFSCDLILTSICLISIGKYNCSIIPYSKITRIVYSFEKCLCIIVYCDKKKYTFLLKDFREIAPTKRIFDEYCYGINIEFNGFD